MTKRRWIINGTFVLIVLAVVYLEISFVLYQQFSTILPDCGGAFKDNSPASFKTPSASPVNADDYRMAEFDAVSFSSRGDNPLTISAWYVPAPESDAPAIIIVHGQNGCKRDPGVLLAGGMLHNAGFHVLMIDLRDQGDSEIEDGRYAGGINEYLDVLGAWDWLLSEQAIPPERIGVMGFSLGAVSVMIAAGEEPQIAAVWEDSGFADIQEAIQGELRRVNFPTLLLPGGLLMARVVSDDDLTAFSPLDAVKKLDGRPLFIVHGEDDERLRVDYAYNLLEAVQDAGGQVEAWIVPGTGHTYAIHKHPDEYETRLVDFFSAALGGP